jgi:transposase-like protein
MRKNHDAAFKAKVALEALKGEKTMAQISSEYGIHVNQIRQWRQKLLEELPGVFSDRRQKKDKDTEEMTSELYRQIGQLKVELDWLKKKSLQLLLKKSG